MARVEQCGRWEAPGLCGEPGPGVGVPLDKGPEGVSEETWPAIQGLAWLKLGCLSSHPLSGEGAFSRLQVGCEKLEWKDLGYRGERKVTLLSIFFLPSISLESWPCLCSPGTQRRRALRNS